MNSLQDKKKVFIDGSAGTTGLRIRERLGHRDDLVLLEIDPACRKDLQARIACMNEADITFLCLPDEAAKEIAACNPDTILLDTSTAHRTAEGWSYGFPELSPTHRAAIRNGRRIAVPGCHASGFVSLVYPLRAAGVLDENYKATCFSLTGYSGGGKKMIAEYEDANRDAALNSPRQYALTQTHKHLPEMKHICSLQADPIFCPIVADFYSGMEVTVPLFRTDTCGHQGRKEIHDILSAHYEGSKIVRVLPLCEESFLPASALSGSDCMEIGVFGNDERILLVARFDNLGKGASGAAVQCMNLLLGLDETNSLSV